VAEEDPGAFVGGRANLYLDGWLLLTGCIGAETDSALDKAA
jgi:hypothetical protein